jgi:dTDP-N-acetylfucosamine:lipid II N-acetylfucosaminyltransferase
MTRSTSNLHIFSPEKFIVPFITFLRKHFPVEKHRFFLFGEKEKYGLVAHDKNSVFASDYFKTVSYIKLSQEIHSANRVFLHGLFNPKVVVLLASQPWLLKKCYWLIWGGDLYRYSLQKRSVRWSVEEFFRRIAIRRIGNLVTYINGDVELARKWYGSLGKHQHCLLYPSNVVNDLENIAANHNQSDEITIQIGNSADPENHHLELIDFLVKYSDRQIKVYAPLSYGNANYANQVTEYGKQRLGDRFFPMLTFLSQDEYRKYLSSIDIAIFHHRRQQGMGNMINLLAYGKKVFVRPETSAATLFTDIGITYFCLKNFSLERLPRDEKYRNMNIIRSVFSISNLADQWAAMVEN